MIISSISYTPLEAARSKTSQQEKVFAGNGYKITFKVTGRGSGTFDADVTIKNTSDVILENWAVEFIMPHKITDIENGIIKSDNDGDYIIKNAGSDKDIAPGKSVSFSFKANCSGAVQIPEKYDILSFEEEVSPKRYKISSRITEDSKGTFNGEIRIRNISEEIIEDWKLQFNCGADITSFGKASVLEYKGTHYYIKNAGYNSDIKPGETVVLEFSGDLVNSKAKPVNYILSEIVQKPTLTDSSKDSDKDGLTDLLEENYRTNPMKADTDGDGISDYTEIILELNPLVKDSDGNGKNDGSEDTDGDGLSNLDEIKAGADCSKKDSDGDGLMDGKEVRVYHTSPVMKDTDGDSVFDGDEILLGLNPLKAYSDGVTKDSKRRIQQKLSDTKIEASLKDITNLLVPSLFGAVPGVMDKEIFLNKCDNDVLLKNSAVTGKPVQVEASLQIKDGLKLSFDYSRFLTKYGESAVKMLAIYQYRDHKFIPLNTKKDKKNKFLYADISGKGTYFVLNAGKFLNSIGINPLDKVFSYANPHSAVKGIKADSFDGTVSSGTWVLLSDYQYIELKGEVSPTNGIDSDGDGVSDYKELGTKIEEDLTPDVELSLQAYGVPQDNSFSGVLHTAYADSHVSYIMDYRNFFRSNSSYSSEIGTMLP